jgi:hypothetical protein
VHVSLLPPEAGAVRCAKMTKKEMEPEGNLSAFFFWGAVFNPMYRKKGTQQKEKKTFQFSAKQRKGK